jgi:thiol-disulfide isomerase/thioredoxin
MRFCCLLLLAACEQSSPPPRDKPAPPPPTPTPSIDAAPAMRPPRNCHGDCLPEVDYVDTIGTTYTPTSLANKIVLVNFWATWCSPCKKEIPELSKVYDAYKSRGVVFLGVVVDNPDSAQLLNFQSDYEMTYPVVRSTADIMVAYSNPDRLPTTYVFDRTGKKALSQIGAVGETQLASLFNQLVESRTP